jgi:hypothetical protein
MTKDQRRIKFFDFVYDIYKQMKANDINLVYEGEITHEITKAFTSLAEKKLENEQESTSVQRKVFHVMVECLQNISKHADVEERSPYGKRGIFMIYQGEDAYSVITGNMIENSKRKGLEELLERINSMTKEELTQLYKKQIKEGSLSEKQGAGLGFIDIARKTGEKLEYHFIQVDDDYSFFILTTKIHRK